MIYKQNTGVLPVLMLYLRNHFCLQYFFKKTLLFTKKTPLCFLGNDYDVVKNNTFNRETLYYFENSISDTVCPCLLLLAAMYDYSVLPDNRTVVQG